MALILWPYFSSFIYGLTFEASVSYKLTQVLTICEGDLKTVTGRGRFIAVAHPQI